MELCCFATVAAGVVPTVGNPVVGEDNVRAEAEEKLAGSPRMIVNEDCFDLFYSICRCVLLPLETPDRYGLAHHARSRSHLLALYSICCRAWKNIVAPARERLIDTLASSVAALAETATPDTVPDRVARNAFKMYIFLLAHTLHEAEQEIERAEDVGRITTKKRSKVRNPRLACSPHRFLLITRSAIEHHFPLSLLAEVGKGSTRRSKRCRGRHLAP